MFVTNLAPVTATKDLFDVFKVAGPVFDIFCQRTEVQDEGSGFDFVRFKIE